MHIVAGHGLAGHDPFVDRPERLEKAVHGGAAGEDDATAALDDAGDIADELEYVAESLFAVENDAFASQLASIPGGVDEWIGNGEFVDAPAPFVFGPAVLKVALCEQHQAEIPMGHGEIRG